ncbi:MAG: hypothetical protein PWQ55_1908 [Chloroflexota bacterium]|nr:hypothetical protein [Chloroflexota bacterium]
MSESENKKSCLGGCLRIVGGGIGLLVLIVLLVAGGYLLLRGAGAYLIYADDLEPADVIVVLSGGTDTRMNEALNLYKEDYSKIIVLTETGEQTEGYEYLNSFDMRIQLMNNGVPSGNIMITDLSVNTTVDEAVAVRDLMQNRQYNSAIVVTDPYHTRRTKLIFNQVFDGTDIRIIVRPVRSSWFNSRTWFTSLKGWQFALLEYAKLISMRFGIAE